MPPRAGAAADCEEGVPVTTGIRWVADATAFWGLTSAGLLATVLRFVAGSLERRRRSWMNLVATWTHAPFSRLHSMPWQLVGSQL